mmetsp:Transcript_28135/g.53260  ORF Transcript_28135/g.53260 Transcript_28135/m.53260 type:complete len:304 (+) Transcript_28135:89-1000(+)
MTLSVLTKSLILTLTAMATTAFAFTPPSFQRSPRNRASYSLSPLFSDPGYSPRSEIFPPTNNDVIDLSLSFPGGALPPPQPPRLPIRQHGRVLDLAGADSLPVTMMLLLHIKSSSALLHLPDFLFSTFLSIYVTFLHKMDVLPTFPREGMQYVPEQVKNPLGPSLVNSALFKTYQRVGSCVSLVVPLVYMFAKPKSLVTPSLLRLLYLLSSELFLSNIFSRINIALPLRMIVPISFALYRLQISAKSIFLAGSSVDRLVTGFTAAYWGAGLLCFLIPVATVKYFRAHMFNVEASEVTIKAIVQ